MSGKGLPLNIQMAQEAYRDRLKALRDERAGALYGETDPNLQIGPDQFDTAVQGIARPVKAAPAADSKAAAAKARAEAAKAGRKVIKEDVKAKRKVSYPRKDYGTITIPVPRYTAAGQEQFGITQATANNQQLANRAFYNFSGDGEYFRGNGMYQTGPGGQTNMRHTGRFSGEGGFFDDLGNFFVRAGKTLIPVAKDVARVAAPVIGNAIAPGIGGMVGSAAANAFLGEGEYEVNDNPMMIAHEPVIKYNNLINSGSLQTKSTAIIESAGDETGDLIFTHNEYIHDLTSSTADFHTLERFEINPGIFGSFPLLSQFAQHYEEYDFIQCIFEYKSLVTDGNSTAAGSVMLCPNYNASNPNLPDKRSIENASGAVSGKVTGSLFCGIECANDKTAYGGIKYVRTVDIDAAGRRMYDLGFLQIAAQGVPAGLAIGELWCRYKVRLSKLKVGGLKIPSVGSGFCLSAAAQTTDRNMLVLDACPDFTSTPLVRATLPTWVGWSAGDDINQVSLTTTLYNAATVPFPYRIFNVQMACVGGSQITITLTWIQATNLAVPAYVVNLDNTDCTIPYTVNPAIVTRVVDPMPNHATYSSVTNVVFGTPGQLGKVNLRVKVFGNQPFDNINDLVGATAIAIVRTA